MAQSDVFIIAEAGVNHNGDMDLARRLIDVAAEAGADAVKFQTFTSASLMTDAAPMADYQRAGAEADSAVEMIRALELGHDQFAELAAYCEQCGILFLSTAFDIDSARFLHGIGMRRFKIPSGEITNAPLIRRIARMADQVIVSSCIACRTIPRRRRPPISGPWTLCGRLSVTLSAGRTTPWATPSPWPPWRGVRR